jgi:multidrug transporter EmrE-like cation transporter
MAELFMIYLMLAILCSFINSMLIKYNEVSGIDTRIVLASNYISASLLGWSMVLTSGLNAISPQTLFLSSVGGILWPASFYMLMWGIRQYGMSLAGALSRLSLIIPLLFALFFLRESVTINIILGIVSTFAAFILLRPVTPKQSRLLDFRAIWFFPILVLAFGLVDGWVNLFNTIAPQSEKYIFITLIFSFSGVLMWTGVILKKIAIQPQALVRGLALGVPNFLSTYFLLESLQTPVFATRSAVVYTLFSVAGVTMAFAAGALVWKEKVTRCNILGVLSATGAIILLNIG